MPIPTLAIVAVLAPVAGSILALLFFRLSRTIGYAVVVIALAVSLVSLVSMLSFATSGEPASFLGGEYLGVHLADPLVVDGLAVVLSLVFVTVALLIALYSFSFLREFAHQADYYFFFLLTLSAVVGLTFSSNGLLIYVFWEIATISMWRLVGFYRSDTDVRMAGRAFLLNFFGASLLVLGLIMLYVNTGTFNVLRVTEKAVGTLPLLLIFAGIIAKSATLPLHVWVPAAYPSAPPPVNALLSGIVEKMGIILFLRLWVQGLGVPPPWNVLVPVIGVVSAGVAGGAALIQKELRRVLAYSTVSQLGFIFIGLGMSTLLGVAGAVLYIIAHSFGKAGLFLAAGYVEKATGQKNIDALGGLIRKSPALGISFLLLSLSIMGIPPMIGFFSKTMVVVNVCRLNPWIGFSAVIVALFTMLYLFRLWQGVFLGASQSDVSFSSSRSLLAIILVFAVISLILGIFVSYPLNGIASTLSSFARL
jgi:formate hydrogenlyase subunit 3/multisubunit Na+/H+ antiporter MnhD subunit